MLLTISRIQRLAKDASLPYLQDHMILTWYIFIVACDGIIMSQMISHDINTVHLSCYILWYHYVTSTHAILKYWYSPPDLGYIAPSSPKQRAPSVVNTPAKAQIINDKPIEPVRWTTRFGDTKIPLLGM